MSISKAYIILAHTNGDQLCKMIERLDDGHSFFFLHIDKKASLEDFKVVVNRFTEKIKIVERVAIDWGGFGLINATLNGMRAVRDHKQSFTWVVLLSGQDYPIKPNDHINRFFLETAHHAFFDYTMLPDYHRWSPRGGYYRIDKYFLGTRPVEKFAAKGLNFLSNFFRFVKRPRLRKLKPFAGSQWWTMNEDTLHFVLDYIDKHPRYYAFHKFTFAADEVFFHTIVLNDELRKANIQNDSLRFLIWPDPSTPHPEILTSYDLDNITRSEKLFARKFDFAHDESVLDLVDEHCLQYRLSGTGQLKC